MKKIKRFIAIIFIFIALFTIVGCNKNKKEPEKYSIIYSLDGGVLDSPIYTFTENDTVSLNIPTKDGYNFLGWFDNSNFSGEALKQVSGNIKQNIKLFAKWELIPQYFITFIEDGGNEVEDIMSEAGKEIVLPSPEKNGYNFLGWYLNDELYDSNIMPNKDITLIAKWTQLFKITFHDTNLEDIYYTKSDEIILPSLEVDGYLFSGWYRDYTFTGEPITKIEIGTAGNIILVPKLEKIFTISYNSNDGIMPSEYNEYYVFESEYELPRPTKLGYIFKGWSEKPNSSSNLLVKVPISYEENLTLYASWEKQLYNITYDFGKYAYVNHKQLYRAFFTDFYYYLKDYRQLNEYLEFTGAYTLEDFLNICSNWTGGSAGMSQIGHKYDKYYLRKDVGGNINNQTSEDGFIGYCLENNMYIEFIYFIEDFFAAWRRDEGYTNGPDDPNGTGSDFLASAWASLIDTAKFFYFEKDTLPNYFFDEGDTVPEFYDRIPYIIKNENVQLTYQYDWETGLILVDNIIFDEYIFEGWYDNPEFKGEPITQLEKNIHHDIIVYAKLTKKK